MKRPHEPEKGDQHLEKTLEQANNYLTDTDKALEIQNALLHQNIEAILELIKSGWMGAWLQQYSSCFFWGIEHMFRTQDDDIACYLMDVTRWVLTYGHETFIQSFLHHFQDKIIAVVERNPEKWRQWVSEVQHPNLSEDLASVIQHKKKQQLENAYQNFDLTEVSGVPDIYGLPYPILEFYRESSLEEAENIFSNLSPEKQTLRLRELLKFTKEITNQASIEYFLSISLAPCMKNWLKVPLHKKILLNYFKCQASADEKNQIVDKILEYSCDGVGSVVKSLIKFVKEKENVDTLTLGDIKVLLHSVEGRKAAHSRSGDIINYFETCDLPTRNLLIERLFYCHAYKIITDVKFDKYIVDWIISSPKEKEKKLSEIQLIGKRYAVFWPDRIMKQYEEKASSPDSFPGYAYFSSLSCNKDTLLSNHDDLSNQDLDLRNSIPNTSSISLT